MRKADFAELVLSLVTSHERATSIVGDFLEENQARCVWQFWVFVVQTAFCQLWRQIVAAPFGMAGAAIHGMLVEFGYLLQACFLLGVALLILVSISRVYFHTDLYSWVTPSLASVLTNLWVPFRLGRWMSRRYPGREAAGSLTLATLHAAINLCAGLIFWQVARAGGEGHVDVTFFGSEREFVKRCHFTRLSSGC